MAEEGAPAAETAATDGGAEIDEPAAASTEAADQERAGADEANGVAEAQPEPVDAAAEVGGDTAEAPKERSSKHSSRRENDDARERRLNDDGAVSPRTSPSLATRDSCRRDMNLPHPCTQPCPWL